MNNMNAKKRLIDQMRDLVNELEKQNVTSDEKEIDLEKLHDNVIRPLMESRILKNVEVAKMLHLSPTTVANMIAEGYLTTTTDGKVTEYHLWKYLTSYKEKE